MRAKKHGIWLGYLIFGLYLLYRISIMVPVGRAVADALLQRVPEWLAISSWALCPLLAALLMGPLDIPAYAWMPLYGALLVSLIFYAVSFHFHPFFAAAILLAAYLEIYWLLPKWEAKRGKVD